MLVFIAAFVAAALTSDTVPSPPAPTAALVFVSSRSETTTRSEQMEASSRQAITEILTTTDQTVSLRSSGFQSCLPGERGVVSVYYSIAPWMPNGTGLLRRSAIVMITLTGCYGAFPNTSLVLGIGTSDESSRTASATRGQNETLLLEAQAQALSTFRESRMRNSSYLENLLHCGIPLGNADRSSFIAIAYEHDGARIARLDPRGTAARAGLSTGDAIASINAVPVTPENLSALVTKADAGGHWVVDGSHTASFDVQDEKQYEAGGACAAKP